MVVFVVSQMLGEVVDSLREQGHLDFGRAGIALVRAVFGNDFGSCLHYAINLCE